MCIRDRLHYDRYANYNALLTSSNVSCRTKDQETFNNNGERKVPQENTSQTFGVKHPFRAVVLLSLCSCVRDLVVYLSVLSTVWMLHALCLRGVYCTVTSQTHLRHLTKSSCMASPAPGIQTYCPRVYSTCYCRMQICPVILNALSVLVVVDGMTVL